MLFRTRIAPKQTTSPVCLGVILFQINGTKNVPWHILAPAAVACDIYLIRRSAHPRGAFFTLQESNFL